MYPALFLSPRDSKSLLDLVKLSLASPMKGFAFSQVASFSFDKNEEYTDDGNEDIISQIIKCLENSWKTRIGNCVVAICQIPPYNI